MQERYFNRTKNKKLNNNNNNILIVYKYSKYLLIINI